MQEARVATELEDRRVDTKLKLAAAWTAMLAALYALVNIGNLVGEGWAYYILFGLGEIAMTALILFTAWRWPVKGYQ
jgi:hypothetical protein